MKHLNKYILSAAFATACCFSSASMAGQVLYQENFSNGIGNFNHSSAHWRSGAKNIEVTYDVRRTFDSDGNAIKTGSGNPMNGTFGISQNAIDATIRYRVNLRDGYPTMGGKFFGLGPASPITGCKDITREGWSARVVIRDRKPQLYLYDQSKPDGQCGARYEGSEELTVGEWAEIGLYVKLNSRGSASDGLAILYVDGKEAVRKEGIKFYGGSSANVPIPAKIQKVVRTTFLASPYSRSEVGNSSPFLTAKALFDNFVVERGDAFAEDN